MNKKNEKNAFNLPFEEHLWTVTMFAQAGNLWSKAIERSIKSADITVSQLVTLQALFFAGKPMSPTHISRLLPLEVHSITPLIDKLYKRDLVTRRRSQTSRRCVDVKITEQGRKLLLELSPSINNVIMSVFGKLSKPDQIELIRIAHEISYAAANYLGADKEHLDENARILAGLTKFKRTKNSRNV